MQDGATILRKGVQRREWGLAGEARADGRRPPSVYIYTVKLLLSYGGASGWLMAGREGVSGTRKLAH